MMSWAKRPDTLMGRDGEEAAAAAMAAAAFIAAGMPCSEPSLAPTYTYERELSTPRCRYLHTVATYHTWNLSLMCSPVTSVIPAKWLSTSSNDNVLWVSKEQEAAWWSIASPSSTSPSSSSPAPNASVGVGPCNEVLRARTIARSAASPSTREIESADRKAISGRHENVTPGAGANSREAAGPERTAFTT